MSTEPSEMFSQMSYALFHEKVPEATVDLIVRYARSAVRCDEAGVAVTARQRVRTAASTSAEVRQADQYQRSLRQGLNVGAGARSLVELETTPVRTIAGRCGATASPRSACDRS
ncbi:hypothetical protein AERO_12345 [Aeromicrobium fastidiosum]|uniref:hypothetical protein n=1 Tax=Aeromicrobium fastidiosum TaxID=52699 RepID=UPI0020235546|nr:hypothetical protein [Aeromicrobium fastidiosum]MCL8252176.1 hypothetical protein [Aeromicrobium fastidiosum]